MMKDFLRTIFNKILSFGNRTLFGPLLKFCFIHLKLNQKYRLLNTNAAAVGHLCVDIDCFLRERESLGLKFRGVLLAHRASVANAALTEIWKEAYGLVVLENLLACYLLDYLRIYPETSYDCSKYCATYGHPAEVYWIRNGDNTEKVIIKWPQELLRQAESLFAEQFPQLDIDRCVVLHSRDSLYDERTHNENYLTQKYRNSDISSYASILTYLHDRNYTVIRIGEYLTDPSIQCMPYLRICATKKFDRDLLEIFLSSKCAVFLGSASGASDMASIWGRPVFRVNSLPYALLRPHYSVGMAIPKLLQSKGRALDAREIFERGYHWFSDDRQYQEHNIELVLNDPSDCIDDFKEFFEAFVEGREDVKSKLMNSTQQRKYKEICTENSYDFYADSLIPRNFFKKYKIT